MHVRAAVAALLAIGFCKANVATIFESIDQLPRGWEFQREARPDEFAQFHISVREQNLQYFQQLVLDISTPGHARYGQHMERDEVYQILKPAEPAVETVEEWLLQNNITNMRRDGHFVTFVANVETASSLLDTDFAWYSNEHESGEHLRTLHYSVPREVSNYINFIHPTIKFPNMSPMHSTIRTIQRASTISRVEPLRVDVGANPAVDASCDYTITPTCLLSLYNIYYTGNATRGNRASFASFLNEYARYTDLRKFVNNDAKWAKGANFSVIQYNGGLNAQRSKNDSTEANLDAQYLLSLAWPTPITEFSTGGCGPLIPDANEAADSCYNEPYLEFLNGILTLDNSQLPQVLSVSYGEDEQTWPISMATTVCNMFSQLGARGVSVLFASGDFGPGAICQSQNKTKQFLPAFPASCPYVTTVGGTQYVDPEEAVDFSGGGFSNYFARPSYQNTSVSSWLTAHGSQFAKYYNSSGRGYPDVAAQGVAFDVYDKGSDVSVGGTSASTPTFAAVIALLNDARLASGQNVLGFLNPFLYSQGVAGLNDITAGSSTGCSGDIKNAGFAAVAGWDPVTGLGTPNFGKLLKLTSPQACNTRGVLGVNPSSKRCATSTATKTSSTMVASVTAV